MDRIKLLDEIINGWKHYIFKNPLVETQAKERITICVNCEHFKPTKVCNICNCFMPAKVRSVNSTCPKGKWGKIIINVGQSNSDGN